MHQKIKSIKGDDGREFSSVLSFSNFVGRNSKSVWRVFQRQDTYDYQGIRYTCEKQEIGHGEEKEINSSNKRILEKITQKYTKEELILLSKGEGLKDKKSHPLPLLSLSGEKHKIGIMSDSHIGSKYCDEDLHYEAFKKMKEEGCECVLHIGDVVEGLCPTRLQTHIYELSHIGYSSQRDHAVEVFSQCNIPLYMISGNHDEWFKGVGSNIVEDICKQLPQATYLGINKADIYVGGAKIRLFHGLDGNPYAKSYRLQKIAEALSEEELPQLLLTGHVHKYCASIERGFQCISVPSLQNQTPWMEGKKIKADVGFMILELETVEGKITSLKQQIYSL